MFFQQALKHSGPQFLFRPGVSTLFLLIGHPCFRLWPIKEPRRVHTNDSESDAARGQKDFVFGVSVIDPNMALIQTIIFHLDLRNPVHIQNRLSWAWF